MRSAGVSEGAGGGAPRSRVAMRAIISASTVRPNDSCRKNSRSCNAPCGRSPMIAPTGIIASTIGAISQCSHLAGAE